MGELKELHDQLLARKPEGAAHDEDTCEICQASDQSGDDMADKTFTEAEAQSLVANAVAEAVKPLEDQLTEFKGSQQTAEIEAKIAEAHAEGDAKVEELQKQLDTAVIEAQTAKDALEAQTAYLTDLAATAERDAEVARLRDERVEAVAEVASFPEDYVKTNAERWASMESEAFEALLEDYKAAGAKPAPKSANETIPSSTALHASREEGGFTDAVKEVIRLRDQRVDPRHI